jgi:hypothetical protein
VRRLATTSARVLDRFKGRLTRAESRTSDESGAVLVLALIFLVSVSLIVTALLTFVGSGLSATASFNNQRNLEYAATSTVNLAIQQTKTTFNSNLLEASPPAQCWGPSGQSQPPSQLTINGYTIYVWCSMTWQPLSGSTRTVTYSACPAPAGSGANTTSLPKNTNLAATCASSPLLQAIETFDDYAADSPVTNKPVPCSAVNTCGQTQNQDSWIWNPVVPQVFSISSASGPANGQTTFTITGSGFVPGTSTTPGQFASSVNLVWETGPSAESWTHPPNAPNQPETDENGVGTILPATVTSVSADGTTIQAVAPAVSTGPYYFVTVTTPGGTSAYTSPTTGLGNVFTYTVQPPLVTGVTGNATVTGGALLQITGSAFFNASNFQTQVWFVQSGSSLAVSSCLNAPPTQACVNDVTVNSSGTLVTGISPSVSSTGTWNVVVVTLGGTSSGSTTISLGVQVPLITSVSPTSGAANPAQITINGTNFLLGSTTVWFCVTSPPTNTASANCANGTPGNGEIAASTTVTSGIQLAVSVPTSGMTVGQSYNPIVQIQYTNSGGTTSTLLSEPYAASNVATDAFTFT